MFIFVLPGLIARVLWPEQIQANPDMAYPLMLTKLLPSGLAGLVIAALLAALISSLSAVFNSCSSLFTMDIYQKINPKADDKRLVLTGRLFTGVIVIIGILWIPLIRHLSNQIYQYLQAVQAYISPPITAVFVTGIIWKKTTGKAAYITLISGGIIGIGRFALDIVSKSYNIGALQTLVNIPFLNFCIYLFVFCTPILFIISQLTTIPREKIITISQITLSNKPLRRKTATPNWRVLNIAFSILVALTVISLWTYFS